jgi:hypothetical protein
VVDAIEAGFELLHADIPAAKTTPTTASAHRRIDGDVTRMPA